jgi:hypothetical protein
MTTVTCAHFEDTAEELALGYTSEPQRAELLAHAASCGRCSRLLRDLSTTVDRLLELSPEAEPPIGFETRAMQGMRRGAPPPATGRPSRSILATVAAACTIVGLLAGVGITRATSGGMHSRASDTAARIVSTRGASLGVVEVYDKPRPRVVVVLDAPRTWRGTWSCELQRPEDGSWARVGTWTSADAPSGAWTAAIPPSLARAHEMRILAGDGTVIATAHFA